MRRETGFRHVGADPLNAIRTLAKASSGRLQRRFGKVEYRDVRVTPVEEVIDQRGGSPANVDHTSVAADMRGVQESQGSIEMRSEPAYVVRAFGRVDRVPVLPVTHGDEGMEHPTARRNGRAYSGEPSERPGRMRGRRVHCTAMFGEAESAYQLVVLRVSPDPEPDQAILNLNAKSTVPATDPNGSESADLFEL